MEKKIQAKGWFLTYPKCTLSKDEAWDLLQGCYPGRIIEEYIIAQEQHKDGTPHLHIFVKYQKKVMWGKDRWDLEEWHGNYQVAKSWNAVAKYCQKGGDFITNLNDELFQGKHVRKNKQLLEQSAKEAVDNGLINLLDLPKLIQAKALYRLQDQARDQEGTRGTWIYGKPGVGKSHRVRTNEQDLYIKSQNKWWDGYEGQEAVLIDDFDLGGKCLGHYLKIWADKWACTGEIKGSTIPLNFKRLYITSNYSIEQIFTDDLELQQAIKRRFEVIHMLDNRLQ